MIIPSLRHDHGSQALTWFKRVKEEHELLSPSSIWKLQNVHVTNTINYEVQASNGVG